MKTAFLDCFSGISGDMFAGALLDAGLDLNTLQRALGGLPLKDFRVEARQEHRNGIYGTRFLVHADKTVQEERSFEDILKILGKSTLPDRVKERSISVFKTLAEAESRIHGEPLHEVHFHEVGAVDSIVDIVSAAVGLEVLGIERLFCSPLPLGSGFVKSRHGTIPVPAPATLEILKGVPVKDSGLDVEMVTPTGAALARVFSETFGPMPSLKVKKVGYGVGGRNLVDRPNLLRIVLGESSDHEQNGLVTLLEANLDDSQPEWTGFLVERLFAAGALDVWLIPVQMKKNRPGVLLQALTSMQDRDRLAGEILQESTSLGVRFQSVERKTLMRETAEVETPWGPMEIKRAKGPDGVWRILPEYEACRRVALENGVALRDVYFWVYGNAAMSADNNAANKGARGET